MGNNIEKNHIARVTYEKTLRASPNKKAAKPLPYKPSPRGEGGPRQRRSGAFVSSTNAPLFPCTISCLSCHSHPIRPCGAPSPRGEGCDTRLPSSKQATKPPHCEIIHSPSTVIPSAAEGSLLHCRHMHICALTQATPWCFLFRLSLAHDLPISKKDPSTSVGMTSGRQIASHSFSHRLVDPSCAFGAGRLASQEGALMGRLGASLD